MSASAEASMRLDIAGMGIVFYALACAPEIAEGANFLAASYTRPAHVAAYVRAGTLVGFCTGSPGSYTLRIRTSRGEPDVPASDRRIRLGLRCEGGRVCFRDLFDLLRWTAECPPEQTIALEDGFYRVTVCTRTPDSGVVGDDQEIRIFLERVEEMPRLAWEGVPMLCD